MSDELNELRFLQIPKEERAKRLSEFAARPEIQAYYEELTKDEYQPDVLTEIERWVKNGEGRAVGISFDCVFLGNSLKQWYVNVVNKPKHEEQRLICCEQVPQILAEHPRVFGASREILPYFAQEMTTPTGALPVLRLAIRKAKELFGE